MENSLLQALPRPNKFTIFKKRGMNVRIFIGLPFCNN